MSIPKPDPYASEAETRALLVPDTRTTAEKHIDGLLESLGANEQGVEPEGRFNLLRQIAVTLAEAAAQPAPTVRPTKDVEISNMGKPFTVKAYVTPLAQQATLQDPLSFNCSAGCGACGVKLQDFVTHQTQAQEGGEWVVVDTEPQIVSTCCGSPVEVWDERKQDITASVDATSPAAQEEIQRLSALVRAQQITIDKLEAQTAPVHFAWMRYEADCAGDPVLALSRSTEEGAFRVYKEPPAAQPAVLLTAEDVRKAGGIVHSDGNIFFTNIAQLNRAHGITEKGGAA